MPGVDPAQWRRAAELSVEGIAIGVSVGVHPWRVHDVPVTEVGAWAERAGACAIGEVGWDAGAQADRDAQDAATDAQLELARALDLPVILHVVGAHGHAIARLERHGEVRGVVHGYSGSAELARRYVRLGCRIGIGPSVLRPKARRAVETARALDDGSLLIETDAPDQAPPDTLVDVLTAVAAARGQPARQLADVTWRNARDLFGFG